MRRVRLIAMMAAGVLVGAALKRWVWTPSAPAPDRDATGQRAAVNADLGKTPADLPPSYIREPEFPTDTFNGLTAQQTFTVLKVANEKSCSCGCPNDSVAKCRTHDPDCTTAPRLLGEMISYARSGLSSSEILQKMDSGTTSKKAEPTAYAVPVGSSPVRGKATAQVTLVEFADFQCPYCQQLQPVLNALRAKHPDDLRIVFKHNPLPFHGRAVLAAEAALAAGDQGKFWEMHDLLFRDPSHLEREDLIRDAAELKLDAAAFSSALDRHAHQTLIDDDRLLASQLGDPATPLLFVNGTKVAGLQTQAALEAIIEAEKARADRRLAEGVTPEDLYGDLLEQAHARLPPPPPPRALSRTAHHVAVPAGAPTLGPPDAPVTLVEWGDFQCPFTARAAAAVKTLKATYGDQLRIVWRNQPLESHPAARPAALAALAAAAQGKFWEVHDVLLAHADGLRAEDLEALVKQAGVDLDRWRADLVSPAVAQRLESDIADGKAVGAVGTPSFFVNGLDLNGAQPVAAFAVLIDDQIQRAAALHAKTPNDDRRMSETLMAQNVASSPVTEAPLVGFADAPVAIDLGNAPSLGPADAPVTIVEFSDFECAFCANTAAALTSLMAKYPGKLRVVFKQTPLTFHTHSAGAAEAALAAAEQDKFWPMEEQLFQHLSALDKASLEGYAKALGLDMPRYKSAVDSERIKLRIQDDVKQAMALGVNGTPTSFINGHRLIGAVPFDTWTLVIDAELARLGVDAGR